MKTLKYKGIEIEIWNDTDAQNPWENWDGCVPLISDGGHRGDYKDYSDGGILNYLRNFLSHNQVRRFQTRILEMMGENVADFKDDYPVNEYDRTEMIQDDLLYSWLDDGIENMEIFCLEFGIKHYKGTSIGYSQSDWTDIFICWTPEFGRVSGRDYKSMDEKDFEGGFKLFGYWAWGDAYGFTIDNEIGLSDSCGGFYGDDHEESGLMEMVRDSIDYYLNSQKLKRYQRVKDVIKNKVPLTHR